MARLFYFYVHLDFLSFLALPREGEPRRGPSGGVGGHERRHAWNLADGSYRWGRASEEGERGGRRATGTSARETAASGGARETATPAPEAARSGGEQGGRAVNLGWAHVEIITIYCWSKMIVQLDRFILCCFSIR
jgi:hypothetical protein